MTGDLSTTLYNPYQVTRELGDVYFQAPMKIGHCQLGKDVVDHFSLVAGSVAVDGSPLGRLILESDGDTLKEILKYLEPRDLLSMRRVCTLFFDQMVVKYPGLFLVTQKPTLLKNGYNQSQFLIYPSLHLTSYQFMVEDPNYFYPNRDFYISLLDDIQEVAVNQKLPWAENIKEMDPRRVVFLTVRHYFQEFFAFTKGAYFSNDDFDKLNLLQWWYLLRPRYVNGAASWAFPRGGFLALWQYSENGQKFLGTARTPYTIEDVRLFKPAQLKALTDVLWYNLLTCCDWSTILLPKWEVTAVQYHDDDDSGTDWWHYKGPDMCERRVLGAPAADYFSHDFFKMLADFEADELSALGFLLPFCSFVYGAFYKDNKYDDQVFVEAMQRLEAYEATKRAENAPIYTINHAAKIRPIIIERMGTFFEGYPTFSEFLRCWVYYFDQRNKEFLSGQDQELILYESLIFFPQSNVAKGMSEALWQGIEIVDTVTQVVKFFHSMRDEFRLNAQNRCSFVPNFLGFYNPKKPTDAD